MGYVWYKLGVKLRTIVNN